VVWDKVEFKYFAEAGPTASFLVYHIIDMSIQTTLPGVEKLPEAQLVDKGTRWYNVAATFSSQSSLLAWVWATDPAGDPKYLFGDVISLSAPNDSIKQIRAETSPSTTNPSIVISLMPNKLVRYAHASRI